MNTTTTYQQEERLVVLDLQRLLYCMEHNPQDNNNNNDNIDGDENESWQSILLRAQLAQDLWSKTVAHLPMIVNNPSLHKQLASQVDLCCRKAQEIASIQRLEEQNNDESKTNDYRDVVERLFFAPTTSAANDDDEDGDNDTITDEEEKDFTGDYEEDDDNNNQRDPAGGGDTKTNAAAAASTSVSVEELQKAQREQIEEAISQMASQLKATTKNIQSNIKRQTDDMLEEIEDVAAQNVEEVKTVVKNVQQHNVSNWKRNIGSWTMFFTLVGIFVFCLLTIFTIPKRKDACLFFCNKENRRSDNKKIPKFPDTGFDSDAAAPNEWDDYYDPDELEQQEKARLDAMMESMNRKDKDTSNSYDDDDDDDDDEIPHEYMDDDVGRSQWDDQEEHDTVEDYYHDENIEYHEEEIGDVESINDYDYQIPRQDIDERDMQNRWDSHPQSDTLEDYYYNDNLDENMAHRHQRQQADRKKHLDSLLDAMRKQDAFKAEYGKESHDSMYQERRHSGDRQQHYRRDEDQRENGADAMNTQKTEQVNPSDSVDPMDAILESLKRQKEAIYEQNQQKLKQTYEDRKHHGHNSESDSSPATQKKGSYQEEAFGGESNNDDILATTGSSGQEVDDPGSWESKLHVETYTEGPSEGPSSSGGDAFERSPTSKARFAPKDLRLAAANGDYETVESYLNLKPEYLNRADKHGWSALHLAVRNGHVEIVELLIEFGCDIMTATKDGVVPMSIALTKLGENHLVTELLRNAGATDQPVAENRGDKNEYHDYIEEGRNKLDAFLGSSSDEL